MAEGFKKDFIDELKSMKDRMEEIFTKNFDLGSREEKKEQPARADWIPMTDIIESGNDLIYAFDLPGVQEDDIQVECKADRLWVSGLRKNDLPRGEAFRVERPRGAFSRVFEFPCPVDEDRISAEFKKGVLRITVPKRSTGGRAQRIVVREVE